MIKPEIKGFHDPQTGSWTYVVSALDHDDRRCAVFDSVLGFDQASGRTDTGLADAVITYIKDSGLELEWIIETHIHADHLTAAPYIKAALGGKTGITCKILDSLALWGPFFEWDDVPTDGSQFDVLFDENAPFTIGPMDVRVMHTPGHTPADTVFVIGDAAIVGDAMLMPDQGTGRCDFPGGSAKNSWESIQKILTLPDETRIYIAHDYPAKDKSAACMATVADHKERNIRVKDGITAEEYITKREADDAQKPLPKLILPSLQVNLRAGVLPEFLKLPLNRL